MQNILVILVFIFIYFSVALEKVPFIKINRLSGVIVGIVLLLSIGHISISEVYSTVSWDVIAFLMGMMIITAYLQVSGFFELGASYILKKANNGRSLLLLTMLSTASMSALFLNDTVCLLFTPVVLILTSYARINAIPYLLSVAFSSNIGSSLTVTGNPHNMYIGITSNISFIKFTLYSMMPVIFSLLVVYLILSYFYSKDLGEFDPEVVHNESLKYSYNSSLGGKTILSLLFTLVLFLFKVDYPVAALSGASLIIIISRMKPDDALSKVDWQLLAFFAGLSVIMVSFGKSFSFDYFIKNIGLDFNSFINLSKLGGLTLLASNLISNLPAVLLIYPVLDKAGVTDLITIYVAQISTFAGNLTLFGSVANLIVAQIAKPYNINISFMLYLRCGFIITIISCLISTIYIYGIDKIFKLFNI